MKLSKKISSFLLSSFFMLNLGITQSKAKWITIEGNISKSKVIDRHKSNWCWAHSGAKMLECLGIKGIQAARVATSAGHTLNSDYGASTVESLFAVRELLPKEHKLKPSKVLNLSKIKNGFGMLTEVYAIGTKGIKTSNGIGTKLNSKLLEENFDIKAFLSPALRANCPVMAYININGFGHIILITGIDMNFSKKGLIEQVRYWDMNRGEVIEPFGQFMNKCSDMSFLYVDK